MNPHSSVTIHRFVVLYEDGHFLLGEDCRPSVLLAESFYAISGRYVSIERAKKNYTVISLVAPSVV